MKGTYNKVLAIGVGALAFFAAATAPAQTTGGNQKGIQKALREQAIGFRENGGQWDQRAKFLSQAPGLDYWVTKDGFVIDQYRETFSAAKGKSVKSDEPYSPASQFENYDRRGNVVRVSFVGASQIIGIQKAGVRPGTKDYLVGDRPTRGTKSYSEALISQIYPGVHVRHYQKDGALRYDIIVDPGQDPRQIEMKFGGVASLDVTDGKKIVAGTSMGSLNMADLHVYQPIGNAEKVVDARFVKLPNGHIKIELGSYDPRLPLVIDPLVFGSYLGSNGTALTNADEVVNSIYADSTGNLYMTGVTSQTTFPINEGPYDKFNVEGVDAYLNQMDGNAYTIRYSAVLGGTGTDTGLGVSFEETTRTVWVGGTTTSTDFAGRNNAKGSGSRVWLSKFTFATSGVTPLYSTYVNDPGTVTTANFAGLKVSSTNKVYVAGNSTVSTLTGAGYTNYLTNTTVGTKKAGFVICLDEAGTVVYRTMIGGKVDVVQNGMAINNSDELALVGYIDATNVEDTGIAADPTFATTDGVYNGVTGVFSGGRLIQNRTAYVIHLKDDGTGLWACTLGGADRDDARAIAFDTEDNVFVTGVTSSFNFQRTPGGFRQDFSTPGIYVTKIRNDGGEILYSTGLGTVGNVVPTSVAADGRGNCFVGGVCGFTITSPFPGIQSQTIPGSIVTTARPNDPETAIDATYNGGDKNVDALNIGADDGDVPSTTDGFITVLNPSGASLQYSSYIGEGSDDRVNQVFVDGVGGCWVAGYSQVVWNKFVNSGPVASSPNGIGAHITANAFKTSMPTGGPGASNPNYAASNGWVVKLRVVLPRLAAISVAPTSVSGGFGVQATVSVALQDPAPAGGVLLSLTASNSSATSWDPNGSVSTTSLTIPEGATGGSLPIYSLPVVNNQVSSIKVFLDNDFKETRLTVLPWLSDMTVSPQITEGGNDIILTASLSNFAPLGGVPVVLSTDRPDVITLPQPAEIVVPENAKNAQVTIGTKGVASLTTATITASFLGVNKSKTVTLKPGVMKDFTFSPTRVNRGDNSTGTVRYFGAIGGARTVTISQVAGDAGAKVNGQALPVTITVPDQAKSFTMTVTAPLTISQGFVTLKADDGVSTVNGTLNIDQIDILDVVLSPGTDVTSGTVINGQVTLTRPAGPNGLTVTLSNTNPAAGSLSRTSVTIPAGQTASGSFQFKSAIVPADVTTEIHATKTGFTDRFRTVTVRGVTLTMTLSPSSVVGGEANSSGTVTLSKAAPAGGMPITLSSSNTGIATFSSNVITIVAGQKTANFTVITKKTATQKVATITATASSLVTGSKNLTVKPPTITSVVLNPTSVLGGNTVKVTINFSSGVASGTVVSLTTTPSGIVTLPATVTVGAGLKTITLTATTKAIAVSTSVAVKATLAPSSAQASVIVRSPGIGSLKFSPTRVVGPGGATGTITLDGPAPPGGVVITVTSGNSAVASIVGSNKVTILAGKVSGTFKVATKAVSRTVAVQFTASSSLGTQTGYLYVDP